MIRKGKYFNIYEALLIVFLLVGLTIVVVLFIGDFTPTSKNAEISKESVKITKDASKITIKQNERIDNLPYPEKALLNSTWTIKSNGEYLGKLVDIIDDINGKPLLKGSGLYPGYLSMKKGPYGSHYVYWTINIVRKYDADNFFFNFNYWTPSYGEYNLKFWVSRNGNYIKFLGGRKINENTNEKSVYSKSIPICRKKIISQRQVKFGPWHGQQFLRIVQKPTTNGTCDAVAEIIINGKVKSAYTETSNNGIPGNAVYQYHIFHLVSYPYAQLGAYGWSTGADAGASRYQIYGYNKGRIRRLFYANEEDGEMSIKTKGNTLTIGGFFSTGCMACGYNSKATWQWKSAIDGWTLKDSNSKADNFAKYLGAPHFTQKINAAEDQRLEELFGQKIQRRVYRAWDTTFSASLSCEVEIELTPTGSIIGQPSIVSGSGNPKFDNAVIRAVDKAVPFVPPIGLPYSTFKSVVIKFNADDLNHA